MLRELGTVEFFKMFAVELAPMALVFVVWLLSRRFRRTFLPRTQTDVDAFFGHYHASFSQGAFPAGRSAVHLRFTQPYAWRDRISRLKVVSLPRYLAPRETAAGSIERADAS
jgi:hypothetical protein